MLTRWRLNMADLPSYDRARAFRLLVALFAIADTRRRERYCVGGCGHEWHRLSAAMCPVGGSRPFGELACHGLRVASSSSAAG
nr:DUF5958 family protein [Streptomyces mirabilis]